MRGRSIRALARRSIAWAWAAAALGWLLWWASAWQAGSPAVGFTIAALAVTAVLGGTAVRGSAWEPPQ